MREGDRPGPLPRPRQARRAALLAAACILLSAPSCEHDHPEVDPPLEVLERVSLEFPAGRPIPLSFYSRLALGPQNELFLSAPAEGIFPSDYDSLYAFRTDGRFIASIGPSRHLGEIPRLVKILGVRDGRLYVAAVGLVNEPEAAEGPWTYLLDSTLNVTEIKRVWRPGVLASSGEVFIPGPVGGALVGEDSTHCVNVRTFDSDEWRSFGECPPGFKESFLQQMAIAVSSERVFWAHFREPTVHVATTAGEELFTLAATPRGYVSFQEAQIRLGADTDYRTQVEETTLLDAIVPAGDLLLVSYRVTYRHRPQPDERFWINGAIVQVFDLKTRIPVADFSLPWKLLGGDDAGATYWLHTEGTGREDVRHEIIKARVRVPSSAAAPSSGASAR